MLCTNRFPLPGSPSTCTLDTALVPLPSFLVIISLALTFYLRPGLRTQSTDFVRASPRRWLHITYTVLVVAAFGMTIVELARLIAEHLGVGLLPMTPIALALVLFVLWGERRGRSRAVSVILMVYWLLLTIFEAIKSARLRRLFELNPAKDSQYPSSDQFLDNVVMLGLFFVFSCIEATNLFLGRGNTQESSNTYKLQDAHGLLA